MRATTVALLLGPVLGFAQGPSSCEVITGVEITFYGAEDNNPPGSATAYNCGGRNYIAGGVGTYDNPLTFASDPNEYAVCEVIYLPYLQKYLRMEDECARCVSDWGSGIAHIDIWTGDSTTACEDDLTPNFQQSVVRGPASNLPVQTIALYNSGTCETAITYPGDTGSCSGSGSSTGGCQTGCSWAGHCIGCPCATFNDCSGDFICTNGLCAAS